jgi:hypothetical protein
MDPKQGDRIGQVFACWAGVYFDLLFENYKSSPNYWATFFHGTYKSDINFDKKWLGYLLVDSSTSPSGRSAPE